MVTGGFMARKGVETFGRTEFEAALPTDRTTGRPLFWYVGMVDGEHCYIVRPFPAVLFGIMVRSSIGADGVSRATGEDSIRAQIVKLTPPSGPADPMTWEYYGGKSQRWITRVSGWGERMTDVLRKLANQIQWLQPCPKCAAVLVPFTSRKKESPVKGKGFVRCEGRCYNPDTNKSETFYLTDDDDKEPIPPGDTFKPKTNGCMVTTPATAPTTTEPAPVRCPQCGKMALAQSKFNPAECYCFPKWGGCRFKGHSDLLQATGDHDGATTTPDPGPARGVSLNEAKRAQAEGLKDTGENGQLCRTVGRAEGLTPTTARPTYADLRRRVVAVLEALDDADSSQPLGAIYHNRDFVALVELKRFLRSDGTN